VSDCNTLRHTATHAATTCSATHCNTLQHTATHSVLQSDTDWRVYKFPSIEVLQCMCCSVLLCIAVSSVCCSVLQCIAVSSVCCSVLQCISVSSVCCSTRNLCVCFCTYGVAMITRLLKIISIFLQNSPINETIV